MFQDPTTARGDESLLAAPEQHASERSKSDSQAFALEKYYLDVVTEDGNYFIGYAANLRFKCLSLGYADTVHSLKLSGIRSGPKISNGSQPVWNNKDLTWKHPGLGFDGRWSPLARPENIELLSTPQGRVDWHCLQPAAEVSLRTASGHILEGVGYCEHLTMTLPPWRLGLSELLWGRFACATHSLIWIVWRGTHPKCHVIHNGVSTGTAEISEQGVIANDFALEIAPVRNIRQGYLGENILSKVPSAYRLAPTAFLEVREQKKLGRGTLKLHDGLQHEGWVIHEKISWPI
jgi:hypothetical protein